MTRNKQIIKKHYNTRSKTKYLVPGLSNKIVRLITIPISPSHLFDYFDNNCSGAFLKEYHREYRDEYSTFTLTLFKMGNDFEKKIIDTIRKQYNTITICKTPHGFNGIKKFCQVTKYNMKERTEFIHSVPLYNKKMNIYGIADCLVRSDIFIKLFPGYKEFINQDEPVHYVIIDIKYKTVQLTSNGYYTNNNNIMRCYKTQLYMYNCMLSDFQSYTPRYAFILGRKYKCTIDRYCSKEPMNRLGVIDFNNYDKEVKAYSKEAIKWIRNMKRDGKHWLLYPPTNNKLYPNMKSKYDAFKQTHLKQAKNNYEITLLPYCSVEERNRCLEKGVTNFLDPNINTNMLGIYNTKRAAIVNGMIKMAQQTKINIFPKKITKSYFNWRNSQQNIYLDFETFTTLFEYKIPHHHFIFMVGIMYLNSNNELCYKNFKIKTLHKKSEYTLLKTLINYINNLFTNPVIYYYDADKYIFQNAISYHNHNIPNNWKWFDIHALMTNEPVIIKDCYSYKLKQIATQLIKHKLIQLKKQTNDVNDGMNAMLNAYKYYTTDNKNKLLINNIVDYNTYDCEILYELMTYLRKHH